MSETIYCSKCGLKYPIENNFCMECGEINKNNLIHSKGRILNNFNSVFSLEHKNILTDEILTNDAYKIILNNILEMGKLNYGNEVAITPLEKVLKIVTSYTPCSYKSKGEELGSYGFNVILVDDRLDESQQIATLIHELAHHLVAEIFEHILMYMWEVKKSPALETFVWFSLGHFENMSIMNEYCAHSVEGRFIPHGFQGYGSFNRLVEQTELDKESVVLSLIFGNTIADDIINILEAFIDRELREEIKLQYKKDLNQPRYDQIIMEQKNVLDDETRNSLIIQCLSTAFNLILENPEIIKQLEEYKDIFKLSYR